MKRKEVFFLSVILACVAVLSKCVQPGRKADPRGRMYAGAAACLKCHQSVCDAYVRHAHYHSSWPATLSSMAGSFSGDSNTCAINDSVKVVMEKRGDEPYEVRYVKGKEVELARIDMVFGNENAQACLTWKGDSLIQLPVSYYREMHGWTKDPGNKEDGARFDKLVYGGCLECHTSYVKESGHRPTASRQAQTFDKHTMIYAVDCERCHGPAANHVSFHTEYPGQKEGRYIVALKSLTRSQRVDMCAVCHSGNKNFMLRSGFEFTPGDTLSHFMLQDLSRGVISGMLGEHGNQAGHLAMSKCYVQSNMDCSTCHQEHANKAASDGSYNQACAGCHSGAGQQNCNMAGSVDGKFLKDNCTGCHMPKESTVIKTESLLPATITGADLVRNHRIAVYPEVSKWILAQGSKP